MMGWLALLPRPPCTPPPLCHSQYNSVCTARESSWGGSVEGWKRGSEVTHKYNHNIQQLIALFDEVYK